MSSGRCPSDPRRVVVTESGLSQRARFSALLFLIQDQYSSMYLHCSLSLCNRGASSCVPVSHLRSTGTLISASMTLQWALIGCYQVLMGVFVFVFFISTPSVAEAGRLALFQALKIWNTSLLDQSCVSMNDNLIWLSTSINCIFVIVLIYMFFLTIY